MKYVIAVFVSRSETLTYVNLLKKSGVPVAVVSTPKEAGRSCGLSAKFSYDYFYQGKSALSQMRFTSFKGFFIQ